jgi:hypothetical protein
MILSAAGRILRFIVLIVLVISVISLLVAVLNFIHAQWIFFGKDLSNKNRLKGDILRCRL